MPMTQLLSPVLIVRTNNAPHNRDAHLNSADPQTSAELFMVVGSGACFSTGVHIVNLKRMRHNNSYSGEGMKMASWFTILGYVILVAFSVVLMSFFVVLSVRILQYLNNNHREIGYFIIMISSILLITTWLWWVMR